MILLKLATKRIFITAIILVGIFGLSISATAEPQLATSTYYPSNSVMQQNDFKAIQAGQISKTNEDSSQKRTAATTRQRTSQATLAADTTATDITASRPTPKPKPVPPPTHCPACPVTSGNSSDAAIACPAYCQPSPTPPPHCAPCGGYRKVNELEPAGHIMCPMYCME
jgi:hypothetical protein